MAKKRTDETSGAVANAPAKEAGTLPTPSFPVVGIGASAGGLEAFLQFLRALPTDTGMAFVLVQHLSPDRESALAEILSRSTTMPVMEVTDEPEVKANHVYVIPPNRNMIIARGHLRLSRREENGVQHPIDLFFRSLAESQLGTAIGVVLSGMATDGTLGLEEIKAEGGITFAQDETAQHPGMPRSAVASGCVDFVLPPEGIAKELERIAAHPYVSAVAGGNGATSALTTPDKAVLAPILRLLSNATNVDFTAYKATTLSRRIMRRMVLLKQEGLADYERLLRREPAEVQALYHDVLINVTSFFRDPEMFQSLRTGAIPDLLEGRPPKDPLRIWVLGCSTGEEAYSLAMTTSEVAESSNHSVPAQIFATDLNAAGIEHARSGVYTGQRVRGVSPERLRKFFTESGGDYRVTKSIRDMCVFARHNVMADPPFSRIDLISCRNLLMYLESPLQQTIIPIFHYALKPGGRLVLGASETIGPLRDLFETEDAKHKIFVRKPGPARIPVGAPLRRYGRTVVVPTVAGKAETSPESRTTTGRLQQGMGGSEVQREVDRLLLSRFAPPAVLVSADLEILEFRGDTQPYLTPSQGKASLSLLKMARKDLIVPLRSLVSRAKKEFATVREEGLRIETGSGTRVLDLEIVPVTGGAEPSGALLVLFQEASPSSKPAAKAAMLRPKRGTASESGEANLARLEHELAATREYLQSLVEQQDVTNEELQSANEEAQSANEELQSINEELETSKEEIQSSNEELTTVNDELQNRNLELGQLTGDLTNLIASVQIVIVMVGRDLRIRRYSPMAGKLLNIIPRDVGRPVTDVRMDFVLPELEPLLLEAIDSAGVREREVQDKLGHWYSLRIRPYMSVNGRIDGAVLALLDIDVIKSSEHAAAEARDQATNTLETVREPLIVLNEDLRVEHANRSFYRAFHVTPIDTVGRFIFDLGDRDWDIPQLRTLLSELMLEKEVVDDFRVVHDFPHIGRRSILLNARRIEDPLRGSERILIALEDVTERERHQEEQERLKGELARSLEELRTVDRARSQFLAVLSHELRSPLNAIRGWIQILQRPGTTEEDLRRGLDVIDRNSKVQTQLIGDLLDAHRIGTGKAWLDMRDVDLAELVEAGLSAVEPAAAEKRIRLERMIEPGPIPVTADPGRLQQVLANLLSNALKFTPPGGHVQVALRRVDTRAEVSVQDDGEGIDAAALGTIFEPFGRPRSETSLIFGGLGLGLSIARQLMELHGGSIEANSPGKGKGAAFTIRMPLRPADEPRRSPAEKTDKGQPVLGGVRILVVDDEADARDPIRRVLELAGAHVVAVESADEAMGAIQRHHPDVLVSDIGMPGGNGYELLHRIRALENDQDSGIRAIALTAYGALEDRDRALEAGFATHLVKPVEPEALVAAVVALLGSRR